MFVDLEVGKIVVCSNNVYYEFIGITDLKGVGSKGADLHQSEAIIVKCDRVFSTPFLVGEKVGIHKVNLGLERTIESVFPSF